VSQMLFFNVGWMERYRGLIGDQIKGGGSHVKKTGWGHEAYNFKPYNGFVYGYVQPNKGSIRLDRFAEGYGKKQLDDVLAVWVATRPRIGPVVVGWYEHATIYRSQQPGRDKSRVFGEEVCPYYVRARTAAARILETDLRTFSIPRGHKGELGESNVWFAEGQDALKRRLRDFIRGVKAGKIEQIPSKRPKSGSFRQPDPAKRKLVERAAIRCATRHLETQGYSVVSRESENVGWDLDATRAEVALRVEVKGWSGSTGLSELSPNEYDRCIALRDCYRICIVRNALTHPTPLVFWYSAERSSWVDDNDHMLSLEPISAARISITSTRRD
jgi:hypothetical protein